MLIHFSPEKKNNYAYYYHVELDMPNTIMWMGWHDTFFSLNFIMYMNFSIFNFPRVWFMDDANMLQSTTKHKIFQVIIPMVFFSAFFYALLFAGF